MNFASHVLIASMTPVNQEVIDLESVSPSDEIFLLGSALPDIASIGKVRLQSPLSNPRLDEGVQNHHFADNAFHHSEWFVDRTGALSDDLEAVGLARGAARACAHVGVELFLDGALLNTKPGLKLAVQGCLVRTGDRSLDLARAVKPDKADEWLAHLERTATWPLPDDYDQPVAVARRLHRIVANRPRLAFPSKQLPMLEQILAKSQDTLISNSDQLLQSVVDEVKKEQSIAI